MAPLDHPLSNVSCVFFPNKIPTIHRFHAFLYCTSKELCHSQWISPSSVEAQIWPQLTHFMTGFFVPKWRNIYILRLFEIPKEKLKRFHLRSLRWARQSFKRNFQICFKLLLFSFSPSNSRKARPLESSLHFTRSGEKSIASSMKANDLGYRVLGQGMHLWRHSSVPVICIVSSRCSHHKWSQMLPQRSLNSELHVFSPCFPLFFPFFPLFFHCLPCLETSRNHAHFQHWHLSGARGSALAANKWRQHSRCLKVCLRLNLYSLYRLYRCCFWYLFWKVFLANVTYQGKAKTAVWFRFKLSSLWTSIKTWSIAIYQSIRWRTSRPLGARTRQQLRYVEVADRQNPP